MILDGIDSSSIEAFLLLVFVYLFYGGDEEFET